MANAPHNWLKATIEAASGVTAWPVEMTGGGDPPYAIYTREATAREQLLDDTFDATPEADTLHPAARFTVVIYADSYTQAWQLARAVSGAIHKFSGSAHGETIDHCLVLDERDGDAGYLEGREQPTYTVEQSVEIRFSEE
jgi:hypothetical protein